MLSVELKGGAVEHRALAGITHQASEMRGRATFLQGKDERIVPLCLHHLAVGHAVGSATKADGIARASNKKVLRIDTILAFEI